MLARADDPADALTDTLDAHLRAIADRDLDALAATVHPHDVVLITAEGDIRHGRETFLALHREWFASTTWTLETEVVHVRRGGTLATVLLALRYRDVPDVDQRSVLSLVFRRDDGCWRMVQDQNTPVRA